MPVFDLANLRAVVESEKPLRCANCIDGSDYGKGSHPKEEVLISQKNLKNYEQLIICEYCEL